MFFDTCGISVIPTVQYVYCQSDSNGIILLDVSGGSQPYSFLWSDGQIGIDATGLNPGTYTVSITDNSGCVSTREFNIHSTSTLGIIFSSDTTSGSSCTGVASVSVVGGTSPYSFQWSNGETDYLIDSLCEGVYSVTVTDADGCSLSDSILIDVLSVGEKSNKTFFKLFPNPTSGKFNVQMSKSENVEIEIYNVLGEKIQSSVISHQSSVIDISTYPSGIYFLQIQSGENIFTEKIVKF